MTNDIFTIGHSTHPINVFVLLLRRHHVEVLADVRSSPFSRFNPQYNKDELKEALRNVGIRYVFLGKELGARSDDPSCYEHGIVQFDRLARLPLFKAGLERVVEGAKKYRVALMCAEKDPLECHRTILVARYLASLGLNVIHILPDGTLETHAASLRRLLAQFGLSSTDLFRTSDDIVEEAYQRQGDRIAYERRSTQSGEEDLEVAALRMDEPM